MLIGNLQLHFLPASIITTLLQVESDFLILRFNLVSHRYNSAVSSKLGKMGSTGVGLKLAKPVTKKSAGGTFV